MKRKETEKRKEWREKNDNQGYNKRKRKGEVKRSSRMGYKTSRRMHNSWERKAGGVREKERKRKKKS